VSTTAREIRRAESVLVVVFSDDGNALLLKRSQPFEFWQSVTGSLNVGESHGHAAARELLEETGLKDEGALSFTGISRQFTIDPRWRSRFAPGTTENVEYEYRYRLPRSVSVTIAIAEDEHSACEWIPIADAIERVWSWTNRKALEQLQIIQ
jgi:dATP pyrophosphohydrolase